LVPLLGIEKIRSYEISIDNEWIQWGSKKIEEYMSIGYRRANEILEEFKKYQFLLDKGVNAVLKSLFGEPKDKVSILLLEREEIH
jgi:dynein heavy chain